MSRSKGSVVEEKNNVGDVSFLILGIILFFIIVIPGGPFGFLPPNIAVITAIILSSASIMRYSSGFAGWIKRMEKRVEVAGVIILFFFWFLIKVFCIHPTTTDENIYFYMAKRFSEGLLPYRDFFFAHPPVHLIIPAVLFKVFGFNIVVAKMIPITATLVSGIFLYKLLGMLSGRTTAFVGTIYYLFAYQVLMASSDMTGINITMMFVSISIYYLFVRMPVLAGIFSALALSSGLYSFAVIVAVVIYLLITKDYRGLLRYMLAAILLVLLIFGTFYVIGRESFITGVFKYHTLKSERLEGKVDIFTTSNPFKVFYGVFINLAVFIFSREFLKAIYFHSYLFIPFLVGGIYFIAQALRDFIRRKGLTEPPFYKVYRVVGFALLTFIIFLFEYSSLKEVYDFYLVFLYFFMAMVGGYLVKYLCGIIQSSGITRAILVTGAIIILLWLYRPLSQVIEEPLFGQDVKKEGEKVFYNYKEPHLPSMISDLAKALYFKEYRTVGQMEPFYRHYIWNKNLSFEKAYEIADYVRSTSKKTDKISGASTIAPLIALLSGRGIAAEEIDTNAKRFKSNLLTDEDFFRRVCSDNLRFFITTARAYFSERYVVHSDFLRNNFVEEKRFSDSGAQHFKPLEVYLFRPVFDGCGLLR